VTILISIINDLIALGFTESEAKIYLALLKTHPANGYLLGKITGIPRSMVYNALGRLSLHGAVLKTGEDRSTLYRPVPPKVLLERLEQDHFQLTRGLLDHLLNLYMVKDEELLWSIRGASPVYSYASQMILESKDEIMLVINDPSIDQLGSAINNVCKDSSVHVKALLTGKGILNCEEIVRHPPLESELQGILDMLVLVVDRKECLIANTNFEIVATITKNPNLVLIARQFIWMELFTQRIYNRIGVELIEQLESEDRRIFESIAEKRQ
jgi:Cd2+/Zn2+-exporting ATPase